MSGLRGYQVKTEFRGKQRTFKQIAKLIGTPIATVYYRYHKGGYRGEDLVPPKPSIENPLPKQG